MCTEIDAPRDVRAGRPHWCDWCGRRIKVGETHRASKYASDGTVYTWRECARCRPYVREMWESYGNRPNRPRTLTFADFEGYMADLHPDVWSEWRGEPSEVVG